MRARKSGRKMKVTEIMGDKKGSERFTEKDEREGRE